MREKATVSFSCAVLDKDHLGVLAVTPFVNDVALPILVSEFEKAQKYEPSGGYGGIVPAWFEYGPLDQYFLGRHKPNTYWAELGAEYILGCECGEVGCWPLECRIKAQEDEVVWAQFRQPHRDARDYSHFGPFVFENAQYKDALTNLNAQLSRTDGIQGDH